MLHITILGQCFLSIPPENIRKQRVFLMLSGSIEIGLWPNGFTLKTKKAKTKTKQQQQQQKDQYFLLKIKTSSTFRTLSSVCKGAFCKQGPIRLWKWLSLCINKWSCVSHYLLGPMFPFYIPENIWKQRVFLMFSGSVEIEIWANGFTWKTNKKNKTKQNKTKKMINISFKM